MRFIIDRRIHNNNNNNKSYWLHIICFVLARRLCVIMLFISQWRLNKNNSVVGWQWMRREENVTNVVAEDSYLLIPQWWAYCIRVGGQIFERYVRQTVVVCVKYLNVFYWTRVSFVGQQLQYYCYILCRRSKKKTNKQRCILKKS